MPPGGVRGRRSCGASRRGGGARGWRGCCCFERAGARGSGRCCLGARGRTKGARNESLSWCGAGRCGGRGVEAAGLVPWLLRVRRGRGGNARRGGGRLAWRRCGGGSGCARAKGYAAARRRTGRGGGRLGAWGARRRQALKIAREGGWVEARAAGAGRARRGGGGRPLFQGVPLVSNHRSGQSPHTRERRSPSPNGLRT